MRGGPEAGEQPASGPARPAHNEREREVAERERPGGDLGAESLSARARASAGSTTIRIAVAARARTTKTPYAAKKPSVSAVRPNSRAMITPTTAARPACTASATAVTAPVARDPRPVETVRLLTDAEAYAR